MTYSAPGVEPGGPATPPPAPRKSSGFFRWRGILGLLFFVALAVVGWMLFADLAIKSNVMEEQPALAAWLGEHLLARRA